MNEITNKSSGGIHIDYQKLKNASNEKLIKRKILLPKTHQKHQKHQKHNKSNKPNNRSKHIRLTSKNKIIGSKGYSKNSNFHGEDFVININFFLFNNLLVNHFNFIVYSVIVSKLICFCNVFFVFLIFLKVFLKVF